MVCVKQKVKNKTVLNINISIYHAGRWVSQCQSASFPDVYVLAISNLRNQSILKLFLLRQHLFMKGHVAQIGFWSVSRFWREGCNV